MVLSIDHVPIEVQGPSKNLADTEADLVVEVAPQCVLVLVRLLFVVYGCERVEGAGHLEYFGQLVLQKLLPAAVVVEAEVGQVEQDVLDRALRVYVVIDVPEQADQVDHAGEIE